MSKENNYNNSVNTDPASSNYITTSHNHLSVSPPYKCKGPFNMDFGDEKIYRERLYKKNKQDLEYLMNLRRPYGDMTQKEWEAHNRKINYMNDVSYIINYYIIYLYNIYIALLLWRN